MITRIGVARLNDRRGPAFGLEQGDLAEKSLGSFWQSPCRLTPLRAALLDPEDLVREAPFGGQLLAFLDRQIVVQRESFSSPPFNSQEADVLELLGVDTIIMSWRGGAWRNSGHW